MNKYNEYDLDCRKIAEKMALSSIHLSELNEFESKLATFLVENDFGEWNHSTIEGEFYFMRHKPYYIDCMSEIEEEKIKSKKK